MIQIVEWGVPARMSGRVYHRGCIKLPPLNLPVEIKLLNNSNTDSDVVIGKAYLEENEEGIFVKDNVEWFIDINYLDRTLDETYSEFISNNKLHPEFKYEKGLSIALMGQDQKEYPEKDKLEFKFLIKHILNDDSLKDTIRDIRLNSLV